MLCTHKTTILCQFGLIICHLLTNSYLNQFSSIFGGNCIRELVYKDICILPHDKFLTTVGNGHWLPQLNCTDSKTPVTCAKAQVNALIQQWKQPSSAPQDKSNDMSHYCGECGHWSHMGDKIPTNHPSSDPGGPSLCGTEDECGKSIFDIKEILTSSVMRMTTMSRKS